MYCEKCGNLMSANMRFCPKCGAPVKRTGVGGYGGSAGLTEGFKKALNFIFDKDDSDMLDEQDKKLIGLAMSIMMKADWKRFR